MNHPYKQYENTPTYACVLEAIKELMANEDIKLLTAEEYVIGYLCHKLSSSPKAEHRDPHK